MSSSSLLPSLEVTSYAPCVPDPVWSGYLITGDLTRLADILPPNAELAVHIPVEPTLLRSIVNHYVRQFGIANAERTKTGPPTDCGEPLQQAYDRLHVVGQCLDGRIRLGEGYNCTIDQSAGDNSITVHAQVGAGEGEPCVEVPIYPGETIPEGADHLDGTLDCEGYVREINGVPGPAIQLVAGPGVTIKPNYPVSHAITIVVTPP